MARITPIPLPLFPAAAVKPLACNDPASIQLPEQDAAEHNSLIATEAWQNLFTYLPPEVVSIILFDLTINELLNVAEYQKGKLRSEAWPVLYKVSVATFGSIEALSEWLSNFQQFQDFLEDAQKYGGKTLRQIFYGLRLLKKMESPISIKEGMRTGMLYREHVGSENALSNVKAQQEFLSWLCEKKARMAVYLRWFPAQNCDPKNILKPDLLEEAVKQNNCVIVKQVCVYMKKNGLHNENALPACENALWAAVMQSNVEIAQYLLDEFPDVRSSQGILQIAAEDGCLPMVKLLVERKIEINALDDYKKTGLQTVIEAFYPFHLSSLYCKNGKGHQETINQLEVIIFLLRQYVDKKLAFNINWELRGKNTFLHIACYLKDPASALWLAKFILEQEKDKNLLKAQNTDGKTPFTCALEAGNHRMYTFLCEQWEKQVPEVERLPPLSLQERQILQTVPNKASPTMPSIKSVLPAPTTIQKIPLAPVQPPITASYTPSAQKISQLHAWVQTFVDFSKDLLTILFFIPNALYTFYLGVIRALGGKVGHR